MSRSSDEARLSSRVPDTSDILVDDPAPGYLDPAYVPPASGPGCRQQGGNLYQSGRH